MQYLVTGKEMKLLDQNTSGHFHVPELVLMEQAAMAFVQRLFLLKEKDSKSAERILIVCGSGNNGADGLAIARLLMQRGKAVTIMPAAEEAGLKQSQSYQVQREICNAYGIAAVDTGADLSGFDLVVDAVFGIGLSRPVEGLLANLIERLNAASAWRVSVDIASGLCSDTGAVLGCAFLADDTITFSFGKLGQYLWPGNEYSGNIHIAPIGITEQSFLSCKPKTAALSCADLALLPKRTAHSNKGTYGKLLVVAGSVNMAGAACLCAKAAYRVGAGLVRVLTPEANRMALQAYVPEAILSVYDPADLDVSVVSEALHWADVAAVGPGIGTDAAAQRLFSAVLSKAETPLVLDADALNILSAADKEQLCRSPHETIITPHLGEMARLTGKSVKELQGAPVEEARAFADRYEVICVLKDFRTVTAVPHGQTYLNLSGNDGMATAGSGDVLTGVIAGLLAQGMQAEHAAALGVFLHGAAGDAAAEQIGRRALMAGDIIDGLCKLDIEEQDGKIPGICRRRSGCAAL